MKKTSRRILFWIFVALFLVTTPVAILYSQGYRFDQYQGIFVHSGSITLKFVPTSVSVYLNGKLQSGRGLDIINNSTTLNGLRPGTYSVRLSASGYQDWEKQIDVHSGISSEFWNIVLAQQNPVTKELDATNLEKFYPSPFGKKIALTKKNGTNLEVWSLLIKSNIPTLVYSGEKMELTGDEFENLEWNYKEQLVILPVLKGGKKNYLIADSELGMNALFLSDLTTLQGLHSVRWSSKEKQTIYFLGKEKDSDTQNLYRTDLDTKEVTLVSQDVVAYDLSGSSLFLVQKNNIIYKSDLSGKNISQISVAPLTTDELGDKSRLIAYDDTREALVAENGRLFVRNNGTEDSIKKISDNVLSVQFSDDGKKLLFWNKNEINVLFLRPWDVQPRRVENEIQQIVRFSTPLDNVFWYRDYEHIFFSAGNKVKIIELDSRDHRTTLGVYENNLDNFQAVYDSGNGFYYFLRDTDSGQENLFYFEFPVKTGIFE